MTLPVLIYQIKGICAGHLIRRYKRFLADVAWTERPRHPTQPPPNPVPGNPRGEQPTVQAQSVESTSTTRTKRKRARLDIAPIPAPTTAKPQQNAVETTVHCPNTGPMTGLLDNVPDTRALCSTAQAVPGKKAPVRKYAHTLEALQPEPGSAWVGVHSALANKLVRALLAGGHIPQLGQYTDVQQEVKYGKDGGSRVDFLLTRPAHVLNTNTSSKGNNKQRKRSEVAAAGQGRLWVEVKSVTLAGPAGQADGRVALFPDTVSERAQKHMQDLMLQKDAGDDAAVVFVVQRGDCTTFSPCEAADPKYAQLVKQASQKGVDIHALGMDLRQVDDELQFWYTGPLQVVL